ncbi:MAG: hypothetical protein ABR866_11710 [Candidatus Korobacteraceae bacterium]|jgi:hypothetical protein
MDPTDTPGSGQPFGLPEDKSPENPQPPFSSTLQVPQASSKHSVGNEPLNFDRGISAGESGSNLLQAPATDVSHYGVSRWVSRIFLVIEVMIWVELGMILVIVPWTRAWSDNGLVLNYPRIREFLSLDFIRGVVTGIGLLDIWVGVWQAIHYKDPVSTK